MSTSSVGQEAERSAARYLEEQGFKIVTRNYRTRLGEIDIIAEEAGILCFIEVRMRTSSRYGEALETITYAKRKKITRAAHQYIVVNNLEATPCRFDVITVSAGKVEMLRNAFDISE